MSDQLKRVGKQRLAAHIVRSKANKGKTVTHEDALEMVEMVFEGMFLALINGFTVSISNFGSLSVVKQAAREGRNPATGETVSVPESKRLRWLTSDHLRDVINGRSKRYTMAKRHGDRPKKTNG